MNSLLSIVVLAAGQGKRMRSRLPKVLQPLGGRPLLAHVLDRAATLAANKTIVVVGVGADKVKKSFVEHALTFVNQPNQQGTGDAVRCALAELPQTGRVLVLNGDVPLLEVDTLKRLLSEDDHEALILLTHVQDDAREYGRVVRDANDAISRIVEFKDASAEERTIREWYAGTMLVPAARLSGWLARLLPRNAQSEYYLTDLVALAVADGVPVRAVRPHHGWEVQGINTPLELAALERQFQLRQAEQILLNGTRIADPARFDLRGQLVCKEDVFIDVNCVFEGAVELGDSVSVGPNCVIRNCTIGPGSRVEAFSHLDGVTIGAAARIGPYARLRPGTTLAEDVHIGNFVEVKASQIGPGSKANHLAYLGDASIGADVNVGAGTITCNYDGANKHRTIIEDRVHIGSDVQLVAPVSIKAGATIAAGTTVWQDAPSGELSLNPKQQVIKPGWKRPSKSINGEVETGKGEG